MMIFGFKILLNSRSPPSHIYITSLLSSKLDSLYIGNYKPSKKLLTTTLINIFIVQINKLGMKSLNYSFWNGATLKVCNVMTQELIILVLQSLCCELKSLTRGNRSLLLAVGIFFHHHEGMF